MGGHTEEEWGEKVADLFEGRSVPLCSFAQHTLGLRAHEVKLFSLGALPASLCAKPKGPGAAPALRGASTLTRGRESARQPKSLREAVAGRKPDAQALTIPAASTKGSAAVPAGCPLPPSHTHKPFYKGL